MDSKAESEIIADLRRAAMATYGQKISPFSELESSAGFSQEVAKILQNVPKSKVNHITSIAAYQIARILKSKVNN